MKPAADPPAEPNKREQPNLTEARRAEHAAKEQRLARALRDNLKRRKEQARAKAGGVGPEKPRG
jgi:hypothetical protein